MRKLANFELANVAMWAFDFDRASSLFNVVIEQSSETTDLLGTWGAIEGSIIMSESRAGNWAGVLQEVQQEETEKAYVRRPVAGLLEDRDRVKRFESFISAKEKEILRNIQRQKLRLRNKVISDLYDDPSGKHSRGQLTRKINGEWFIAVQRLVSICVGRAYPRNGEVPELGSVQRTLHGTGLTVKNSDDRCVVISKDGLTIEIWFDGRNCCTASADRFDDVFAALELITKVNDSALALKSER